MLSASLRSLLEVLRHTGGPRISSGSLLPLGRLFTGESLQSRQDGTERNVVLTVRPNFSLPSVPSLTTLCKPAFLLDNGAMYHIANGIALSEYLITLYFSPSLKAYPYVTVFGNIFFPVALSPYPTE